MGSTSEIALCTCSVIGALVVEVVLFRIFTRELDHHKPNFTVAWLSAGFSIGTIIAFILLSVRFPAPSPARNWFTSGWNNRDIFLFNIPIHDWSSYSLLMIYQITRTLLGSLVTNVFRTYVSVNVLGHKDPREEHTFMIMLGFAFTDLFQYWTSVTDVFITLTQFPFTLVALVAQILADVLCIEAKLKPQLTKFS
jgi:hypothetical protein